MIKANIKSDVLKETRNRIGVRTHVQVDLEGPSVILEEELYKLLKEFEKQIPEVWVNALERVMMDRLEDCGCLEGEDDK